MELNRTLERKKMREKNKIIVSCIEGSQKSEVWNCMYKYKTVEREKKWSTIRHDLPRRESRMTHYDTMTN